MNVIQEVVSTKRQENDIENKIIRDDAFAILEKQCVVLYYPLLDDGDTKHLTKKLFSHIHSIEVDFPYHVRIKCKERGMDLMWKDINPTVSNAMNIQQDKITGKGIETRMLFAGNLIKQPCCDRCIYYNCSHCASK